jgi:hypothetical protein
MADQPDPAKVLVDQAQAQAARFAAAMAPLAQAYLAAAAQLGATLTEFGRQVAVALESSHGRRADRGDPTGDPPL